MLFNKYFKKISACGIALLLIANVGASTTGASAHHVHSSYYHTSRVIHNHKSQNRQYKSVLKYLSWVKRYDLTHKRPYTSRYFRHISRHTQNFNYKQRLYINSLLKNLSKNTKKVSQRNKLNKLYKGSARKAKRNKQYSNKKARRNRTSLIHNKKKDVKKASHHKVTYNLVTELEKPNKALVEKSHAKKSKSSINTNIPTQVNVTPIQNNASVNTNNAIPSYHSQPQTVVTPSVYKSPQIQNNGDNLQQMESQSLTDVNNDRTANGLPALKVDPRLQKFAGIRAQQLLTDYEHSFDPSDFTEAGMATDQPLWENIDLDHLHNDRQYGDPVVYHSNNGVDMANESNDIFMNHDQAENNGHRDNILSPEVTSIGIGASQSDGIYSLAEDMSNY